MLTFVTWLWVQRGYHTQFDASHVNTLFQMIDAHYQAPHRNICVTNLKQGIDKRIEIVADDEDFQNIGNPWGSHMPSCYRRLRLFKKDAAKTFGERIVSMDLDTVITNDLAPLFDQDVDFRIWGQADKRSRGWYNGSLFYLKAGTRPQVWDQFNPRISPSQAKQANSAGSDQGWIGYILGRKEAMWSMAEGVYSFRVHLAERGNTDLPDGARVVNFHGRRKPWHYDCQQIPWIREHYRVTDEVTA